MGQYLHVILAEDMILKLMQAAGLTEQSQVSGFLKELFTTVKPFMEKLHFTGKGQEYRYRFIHPSKEVPRKDVWIPLEKDVLNRIRRIKRDQCFFSLGQIIRLLIWVYLCFIHRFGDKVHEQLEIAEEIWQNEREGYEVTNEALSHMLRKVAFMADTQGAFASFYSSEDTETTIISR